MVNKKTLKELQTLASIPTAEELRRNKNLKFKEESARKVEELMTLAQDILALVNKRVELVRRSSNRGQTTKPKGIFTKRCPKCHQNLEHFKTYFTRRESHTPEEYVHRYWYNVDTKTKVYYCPACDYEYAEGPECFGLSISLKAAVRVLEHMEDFHKYLEWFSGESVSRVELSQSFASFLRKKR